MKLLCLLQLLLALLVTWSSIGTAQAQALVAEWTRLPDAKWLPAGPGPRGWSKLFWDSNAQRLTLLGGSAGGGYKMDIWHFSATTGLWTSYLQPTLDCPGYIGFTAPDGRDAHSTLYDPVNDAYWSVAGSGYKCQAGGSERMTNRVAGAGTTSSVLYDPALTETAVDQWKHWTVMVDNYYTSNVTAYDPVTKKLTLAKPISSLASGKNYTLRVWTDGQTWMYSKPMGTWTGFEPSYWGAVTPSPVVNPPFRHTPGFAWSTVDNVGVFFGGGRAGQGSNDTWVLDPGTKRWTLKSADAPVASKPFQVMELTNNFVYDEVNDVFILFGGRCGELRCTVGQPTGETWAYKLSTNTWTKRVTAVSPPARTASTMYFDESIGKTVLFGGAKVDIYNVFPTAANLLNDTWVYDYAANTWTQITPITSPNPRYNHMMGYDPVAQKGVLYAGTQSPAGTAEMWTLKFSLQGPNTPPTAVAAATPASGTTATVFSFSGAGSSDAGGSIASYSWDFGGGASPATGVSVNRSFATPGTYTVTLTVTDTGGLSATSSIPVTVTQAPANSPPTAVATASATSGTTATTFSFSGAASSDPDGPIASYAWNFGNGTTASGVATNQTFAAAGTYAVTLTVSDGGGLTATSTVNVVVTAVASAPTLTFKRVITGSIANGTVSRILAGGVSVPFTVSGTDYSAQISAATPGAVAVTVEYSGPGGSGSQQLSVVVP